jgi:EAL domain-containing protein (putative c-di-GMP-specific phosphodiesterase class I)
VFQIGASRGDDAALRTDDLPRELRLALWMRQISLDYQPIVDLTTGHLAGMEAYVRWDRPGHGVVPAGSFVDEAAGALSALDQEVLWVSTSLWASAGSVGAHVPLHVNVGLGGATKRLSGLVGRVLAETTLDPALLQVDIPDHVALGDADALRGLEGLAEHGVAINLDDSGRLDGDGLRGLVTSMPVDSVKLDVRAGGETAADRDARVAAVAAGASRAGVQVTVKAVEDVADLERAMAVEARQGQGYLLGHPVSPDACVELVINDRRSRTERVA